MADPLLPSTTLPQGFSTLPGRMPVAQQSQWNLRPDGSMKGLGFLGVFPMPDGGVASENSIADSEHLKDANGKYLDYPIFVPTLTRDEVKAALAFTASNGKIPLPDSVYDKAEAFALYRQSKGLPLFAQLGEQIYPYPDIPRVAVKLKSGEIVRPNESLQRDVQLGILGYGGR